MKKKIILYILLLSFSFLLFADDQIKINVPFYDEYGNLSEVTYVKELPNTYSDAITTIYVLLDIYNEVTTNYKNQVIEIEQYSNSINEKLIEANKKIVTLEEINETKSSNDVEIEKAEEIENSFKSNLFNNIGIIFEYGSLKETDDISLKLGLKFWRLTFEFGPDFIIDKSKNDFKIGLRCAFGFWF